MNGAILPNRIAVPNHHTAARLAFETQILRRRADDRPVADQVLAPDLHRAFDDGVCLHDGVIADHSFRSDDGMRPDLDVCAELRARIDNCVRVNLQSTPASLKLKYGKRPSAGAPMI